MDWLPPPDDFRQSLQAALRQDEPAAKLASLEALAGFRLGYVETLQLDRAYGAASAESSPTAPRIKLAVVSSATVDHLSPSIRVAGLRHGLHIGILTGGFGLFRQNIVDENSPLVAFEPDVVLFSLTAAAMLGASPSARAFAEPDTIIDSVIDELSGLWNRAKQRFGAAIIQQTFLDVSLPLFGNHDRMIPGSPGWQVHEVNHRLLKEADQAGVSVLDIARASERDGLTTWFDNNWWLQGKIEISPAAGAQYGDLVARSIAAQQGRAKKCLVLDLDNTLWGGVVGDDDLDGIDIGEGSAVGEAHLALQRYAASLKERGILLAVCSKNEPATVEEVFERHPDMLLKRSDFAAFVANWQDKAENLRAIAEMLNIGLDSLVFVDDNPAERARVRQSLPMVAVPELPDDVAGFARRVADAGYFESLSFTPEDRERSGQYLANTNREGFRQSSQSMDEFLQGLEMKVEYGQVNPVVLARVTQLFNKTNQFNVTTLRLTRDEVQEFADNKENIAVYFRLTDRFGDNGLVSVMVLQPHDGDKSVYELVNWVMSCRVFGRQLEIEAMNIMVELGLARGVREFRARYVPTARNAVIADLFERLGFSPDSVDAGDDKLWMLDLERYDCRPTFLDRREIVS